MFSQNKTSEEVGETNPDKGKDPALLGAWRRLLDYDTVSTYQKNMYTSLREWVIRLSVIITTLSVASNFVGRIPNMENEMRMVLRVILILLPLISAAVLEYAQRFTSPAWIDYRASAEKIRTAIYLYRMKAGNYKDKTDQQRQELLLEAVETERKAIEQQATLVPYLQSSEQAVTPRISQAAGNDDGFSALTIEQYVALRVLSQRNWYVRRINSDHQQVRSSFRVAQATSILGGFLSGIGLETIVAITAAFGVAVNMNADLRLHGATYALFHSTAVRLDDRLNKWAIIADDGEPDEEQRALFVAAIEDILGHERDEWQGQAKQLQRLVERSLRGNDEDINQA